MPIYEYERADGTTFEVFQSINDEPLKVDPESGMPVRRIYHPPAVHFKGSGFYNTDYGTRRRERERAKEKKESKEGGEGSKGGEKAPVAA